MNINRNVLKIVAGALLMASLPAGAQLLGGGLGGAVNGTLGGSLGSAAGGGAFDTNGAFGSLRDRAQQAGSRTHEAAASATGNARSRIGSARGATDATVNAAHSAGVSAGRQAGEAASTQQGASQPGAAPVTAQPGGLLLNGAGSAGAEKHVAGRTVTGHGGAASQTGVDRSGLWNNSNGDAGISMKKDEPAAPQTPAAQ